jgi:rRNA maturation endonuclease Nob1
VFGLVTEFSKKTGDYGVLSQPDLRVLALTYTLEKRENGDANIRKEPLTVSLDYLSDSNDIFMPRYID